MKFGHDQLSSLQRKNQILILLADSLLTVMLKAKCVALSGLMMHCVLAAKMLQGFTLDIHSFS